MPPGREVLIQPIRKMIRSVSVLRKLRDRFHVKFFTAFVVLEEGNLQEFRKEICQYRPNYIFVLKIRQLRRGVCAGVYAQFCDRTKELDARIAPMKHIEGNHPIIFLKEKRYSFARWFLINNRLDVLSPLRSRAVELTQRLVRVPQTKQGLRSCNLQVRVLGICF